MISSQAVFSAVTCAFFIQRWRSASARAAMSLCRRIAQHSQRIVQIATAEMLEQPPGSGGGLTGRARRPVGPGRARRRRRRSPTSNSSGMGRVSRSKSSSFKPSLTASSVRSLRSDELSPPLADRKRTRRSSSSRFRSFSAAWVIASSAS